MSYQSKNPFSQIPLFLGRPLLWREASSNESFLKMQKHMHGGVDVHLNGKLVQKKRKKTCHLRGFGFTLHVICKDLPLFAEELQRYCSILQEKHLVPLTSPLGFLSA